VDGAFLKAAALLVMTDLGNRSGYGARTTRLPPSLARSFLVLLLLLSLRLRVCIPCQRGPVGSFVRSKEKLVGFDCHTRGGTGDSKKMSNLWHGKILGGHM
jgi:hypothetical protein